jgi:hypothetical protein
VIKKGAKKNSKIQRSCNGCTVYVERTKTRDTINNRGSWNHLKITQTIPEQHNGKARNQETTESSHIGHCTHTAGSADVKVETFNV